VAYNSVSNNHTDTTMVVQCPADGCDYEQVPKSVMAHYSSKTDDAHQGGYHVAKSKLQEQGIDTEDASVEPGGEATDNAQSDSETTEEDNRAEDNPVFDGEPHAANQSTDNPECPDCGGELYHRNELDPRKYRLESDEADYGCLNCGSEFKDE
jgi:hypothetical protein